MTEALIPNTRRTVDARPAARARTGSATMTPDKKPHHLSVLLALSAGAYAASLAGVTWLQAEADRAVLDARAPAASAIAAAHTRQDQVDRMLAEARATLGSLNGAYGSTADTLIDLQDRLDALSGTVADLEGRSLALPTRIGLPSAPQLPHAAAPAPVAHATTGASGGG